MVLDRTRYGTLCQSHAAWGKDGNGGAQAGFAELIRLWLSHPQPHPHPQSHPYPHPQPQPHLQMELPNSNSHNLSSLRLQLPLYCIAAVHPQHTVPCLCICRFHLYHLTCSPRFLSVSCGRRDSCAARLLSRRVSSFAMDKSTLFHLISANTTLCPFITHGTREFLPSPSAAPPATWYLTLFGHVE